MQTSTDDVSKLQGRYSLTLLSPSSRYFSICLSIGMLGALVAITIMWYMNLQDYWRIGTAIGVLLATQYVDSRYIKSREYSKALHASAFGCCVWMLSLLMGVATSAITGKDLQPFFVVMGLFLFASFRIGIYTTVLGCSIGRAWAICFIQPLAIFAVMIPFDMWGTLLLDPVSLGYGVAYLGCATAWSVLTDRSGRPDLKSTHVMVQAYVASQGGRQQDIESMMEASSNKSSVRTMLVRFGSTKGFTLVFPEIHPGPYHPVGGSNITYQIYRRLDSRAMVMHTISDHTLNIPSQPQVCAYLKSLDQMQVENSGDTCSKPVVIHKGKTRVSGIAFGDNAILFMSMSPYGMEDLPSIIKTESDKHGRAVGFGRVMLVDCHNAMGPVISDKELDNMLQAARECLELLIKEEQHPFEIGYSNSEDMDVQSEDMGMAGLGMVCVRLDDSRYYIGWADANNMNNGTRERVVAALAKTKRNLLEVCTSDTHFTPVKAKNSQGYYQLGLMAGDDRISEWFLEMARKADSDASAKKFDILCSDTELLLMGSKIFESYSKAMDKSMNLVKIFMIGCSALFLTTLLI
ncbi:MAG: DUF2070 family protein [Cenarchaeum sp. SB0672_bin_9]|nr:DUF2070 family protein [Cenarchaeum sp. SB0672_bin_9]